MTVLPPDDALFMDRAAALAWGGRKAAPNPMVGAVFVKNGEILGEGYHRQYGGSHAEVEAIRAAEQQGISLEGSTLYVTLEPCCHHGKQGPCTEALLPLKLREVVYAQEDPNPVVKGKGIHILKTAGIPTRFLETQETKGLNRIYLKNTLHQLPFVHLKTACTLDGKITQKKGTETPLGNAASTARVHTLRNRYDAILIGVRTLLIDNPKLTARLPEAKNPIRIILDPQLKTPPTAQIFKEVGKNILVSLIAGRPEWEAVPHTTILVATRNKQGEIDLRDFLQKAFRQGIRSILVEGGETVNTRFLQAQEVDRVSFIRCPLLSEDADAPELYDLKEIPRLEFKESSIEDVKGDSWFEGWIY